MPGFFAVVIVAILCFSYTSQCLFLYIFVLVPVFIDHFVAVVLSVAVVVIFIAVVVALVADVFIVFVIIVVLVDIFLAIVVFISVIVVVGHSDDVVVNVVFFIVGVLIVAFLNLMLL